MQEPILCKICGKRRPKRACPAVHGDICALCCGNERENSLTCPLECSYLQEAHRHEKPVELSGKDLSNSDIEVSARFITEHEELILYSAYALLQAALQTHGAVDTDVVAALESLVKTHRTLESGLVYETFSNNAIAAAIQRSFSASLADYQKVHREREPLSSVRNSDVLKALVFLHRLGEENQNGRPRGRMFIDLLHQMTPAPAREQAPSIIL